MRLRPLDERGLTLTEVAIVGVIGVLVLLGLGGFYLNSQATWLDASSQSVTQREATLVLEAIADSVRTGASAIATPLPDADHGQLELYRVDGTSSWGFWWDPTDSLVHNGPDPADDRGALLESPVERFRVEYSHPLVRVSLLLRSPTGSRIEMATTTLLRNRTP